MNKLTRYAPEVRERAVRIVFGTVTAAVRARAVTTM